VRKLKNIWKWPLKGRDVEVTKSRNKLFGLCLTATILLAAGVIFLPRYFSKSLDMRSLNQVEIAKREEFAFVEPSSNNILESIEAFQCLGQENTDLVLLASFDGFSKISDELLQAVYDQALQASDTGMLFWIRPWALREFGVETDSNSSYWPTFMTSAKYYSLTYAPDESRNTKKMLNFWYVQFSDQEIFDYAFVINAMNYQIYYAEIYNIVTDRMVEYLENLKWIEEEVKIDSKEKFDSGIFDLELYYREFFAAGCASYYNADISNYVERQNLKDKLSLVVLNYDSQPVNIEQRILSDSKNSLKGIGIGIQNLGTDIHKIMD